MTAMTHHTTTCCTKCCLGLSCNVFYYSHLTLLLPNAHRNWYGPPTPVSKLSAQQTRAGTWYRTMVNLWHTDRRSKSYVCIFFGRAYISGIDCKWVVYITQEAAASGFWKYKPWPWAVWGLSKFGTCIITLTRAWVGGWAVAKSVAVRGVSKDHTGLSAVNLWVPFNRPRIWQKKRTIW